MKIIHKDGRIITIIRKVKNTVGWHYLSEDDMWYHESKVKETINQ